MLRDNIRRAEEEVETHRAGIGRAIVEKRYHEGARVALLDFDDEASFITGASLIIDGGLSARFAS